MSSPLRVGVYLADQNPHRDRSQGITVMTESMLGRMSQRPDVRLTALSSSTSIAFTGAHAELRVPWSTEGMLGRIAGDVFHPVLQRRADPHVWWYPKGFAPVLVRGKSPMVGMLADAIIVHYAVHHSETRSRLDLAFWMRQLRHSLRRLDRVNTLSEHARGQLLSACERFGIDAPEIAVVGCGSEWELDRRRPGGREDRVVHVASVAPHKRSNVLLRSWRELQRSGRELPRLALVGSLDAEGAALVAALGDVERFSRLDVGELRDLFASATALALPSSIEGFGLPALEAGYVGTPVLFTPGTAVAEVVGPTGAWGGFEVEHPDSLFDALQRVSRVPTRELADWGDDLYERFALDGVTDRVLRELRAAAG